MVSVLILTRNEEANIAKCIGSVPWADDIVVLDSFSADGTVEIAERLGARVVQRRFDDWATHQNWAVRNIHFKHPWVLYLDADEECDEVLTLELQSLASSERQESAYCVRRKDFFMGRWLRRSQFYPTWIIRIFRPELIQYKRRVNPVAIVDGKVGALAGHLIHYPFSHGVRHWFDRHNDYSDLESKELLQEVMRAVEWRGIFLGDAATRRKELKHLAYKVPGRPLLMFIYLYIARFGFLDGIPGLYYSAMRAVYELMISVKVQEIRWQDRQRSMKESQAICAPRHISATVDHKVAKHTQH